MKTASTDPDATPRVPQRWSWHYQRLQTLRDRLLDTREVQIAAVSEALEPHSMDLADSATDEFDHDLALGMLSQEQDALYELDAAIRRIFEGKYGICEESGRPIPAARLRAVPWTRHTREVEERLEQEGAISRAHLGTAASLQSSAAAALAEIEEPETEEPRTPEVLRHRRQDEIAAIESGGEAGSAATQPTQP